jgi:hypothetical protein
MQIIALRKGCRTMMSGVSQCWIANSLGRSHCLLGDHLDSGLPGGRPSANAGKAPIRPGSLAWSALRSAMHSRGASAAERHLTAQVTAQVLRERRQCFSDFPLRQVLRETGERDWRERLARETGERDWRERLALTVRLMSASAARSSAPCVGNLARLRYRPCAHRAT